MDELGGETFDPYPLSTLPYDVRKLNTFDLGQGSHDDLGTLGRNAQHPDNVVNNGMQTSRQNSQDSHDY